MKHVLLPAFLMILGFSISGYAADPVYACRSAVRRQAMQQFGTRPVDLSINNVNQNGESSDWVSGTFYLASDADRDTPYQFTCAVNDRNGYVRRVDINPAGTSGSADRAMDPARVGMNSCQSAVDSRLRNQGYGEITFDSIRPDRDGDMVRGSVTANDGYARQFFGFSCRIDPNDGDVRSVNVDQR